MSFGPSKTAAFVGKGQNVEEVSLVLSCLQTQTVEMKDMHRHLIRILQCTALTLMVLAVVPAQQSEALAPLGYSWRCYSGSGTCHFWVTTSNHSDYSWSFGDGTFSGISSSTAIDHTYNVPKSPSPYSFTVYLVGYNASASSPDNIIGCTIEVYNWYTPGGDPGTRGTCS